MEELIKLRINLFLKITFLEKKGFAQMQFQNNYQTNYYSISDRIGSMGLKPQYKTFNSVHHVWYKQHVSKNLISLLLGTHLFTLSF